MASEAAPPWRALWSLPLTTPARTLSKRVSGKLSVTPFVTAKMINGERIAVVMPAYNAEKTLQVTVGGLPDLVDISILVYDHYAAARSETARPV